MNILVNGEKKSVSAGTLSVLIDELGIKQEWISVELNGTVIPKNGYQKVTLEENDKLEIVKFVGGGSGGADKINEPEDTPLSVGPSIFQSRLIVGTGKYDSVDTMLACVEASGADVVTVAIRRVNLENKGEKNIVEALKEMKGRNIQILPNTAGCFSAEEAIRTAELARGFGISEMVKLEVLSDKETLLPHPQETVKAAETLVKKGFIVLVYTSDDPVQARILEEIGVHAVMPAGSPIGSGQGVLNPNNIRIILERAKVPIIVDAGVGTASDVARAFELGVEGVLLNSAIAKAKEPVMMARAMRRAFLAGRAAFLAGRMDKKLYATASSPEKDF